MTDHAVNRRDLLRATVLAALAAVACAASAQAFYQWAVPVGRGDGKSLTAYLWVPPDAPRVRGVVIGAEPEIANDAAIRAACTAEGLAIVRPSPHIDGMFNYKTGDGPVMFQRVLDACAAASGYAEISRAPFFSFGHSTSCNYATAVACWQPARCFGVLVFKGGLVLPAYDPAADISGIPILAIKGQFEEFGPGPSGVLRDFEDRETSWKTSRDSYLRLRASNEKMLISLAVEAGTTHMAWSPRDGEYVALFIRKAAQVRIPDWPAAGTESVRCKQVEVTSGALTSTAITSPQMPKAAPYKEYKGDRKAAYWHMDMELATAWEAFHAGRFNKRTQYVAFADPAGGKTIYSLHDLRYNAMAQYVGPDTFKVAGAFVMETRDKYAVPEPPLGHAEGPIQFRRFGGNFQQVGPDTFCVGAYSANGANGAITAFHPGDDVFRMAEQPAAVKLPLLTKGPAQTITFPPVGPLTPGATARLTATSDSGLPVFYAVLSGPATVEGDTLTVTAVPPRAAMPMHIVVGAYQWGSGVEPFVQTAKPVMQTVMVNGR